MSCGELSIEEAGRVGGTAHWSLVPYSLRSRLGLMVNICQEGH